MQQYNGIISCNYPRLDRYISEHLELIARSQLKILPSLEILVDGKKAKLGQKVAAGQSLDVQWQAIALSRFTSENIPLDIIYEDEHVWVIDKPRGMVVHPGAGRPSGTLANALAYRLEQEQKSLYNDQRPGIVHRLDMETSGVIICAKDAVTHAFLAQQFKDRSVKKRYMAILQTPNVTPARGLIDNYIDRSRRIRTHFVCGDNPDRGRRAITGYRLLLQANNKSLVLFKPYTGRTHQLRVHAKSELAAIEGDPIYHTGEVAEKALMLHAWKLQITLPNEEIPRIFMARVPKRFYDSLILSKPLASADKRE
jgi:23S rRNA pseudouridine1911/1915/1917 synthase